MTAFYILIGIFLALACIVTPFLNIFAMPIMGYVLGRLDRRVCWLCSGVRH
jgi:hypothetical protein